MITRWQPLGFGSFLSDMNLLQAEMNSLFDRFGFDNGSRRIAPSYPALNLWRDADNLYIEAELPGMEMKNLDIYINGGNQLSLKGKREEPSEKKGTWHRQERGYGVFARTITLPEEFDVDQVKAEFKDGVLCVTLPKSEKAKPRRIEVKSSYMRVSGNS